ncbi:MAG: DUF4238 domain-containing protein [Promethearchaeota archaeon]
MKHYKQQHYVPRFYLNKFGIKKKRGYTVKCFDKITGKEYVENVSQVCMENYFYDKKAPPKIEKLFSQKEEQHSKVYHKIVENESIRNLSDFEKNSVCEYIFMQNERTKSTRKKYSQIAKKVYKKLEKKKNLPKFEDLPSDIQEAFLESRGEMAQLNMIFGVFKDDNGDIQSPNEIIEYISELEWNLTKSDSSKEFYTSDHPVFVINPIYDEKGTIVGYGSSSYRAEGVEIYFPLSPKLCLILYDRERSDYRRVKPERFVKKDELIWINTQLIAMAHRTIFSRTNDFQFVKSVLDKFPELKDPERDRTFDYNLDI